MHFSVDISREVGAEPGAGMMATVEQLTLSFQTTLQKPAGDDTIHLYLQSITCPLMEMSHCRLLCRLKCFRYETDKFKCGLFARAKDSVKHFHVTRRDHGYMFGFNEFATLQDFVNHFANQPLLGSDTGMQTYSCSVTNIVWYHLILIEVQGHFVVHSILVDRNWNQFF